MSLLRDVETLAARYPDRDAVYGDDEGLAALQDFANLLDTYRPVRGTVMGPQRSFLAERHADGSTVVYLEPVPPVTGGQRATARMAYSFVANEQAWETS